MILLLLACARDVVVDTGFDFQVLEATPVEGATGTQVEQPTLLFNLPADPTTCVPGVLRLDALTRDAAGDDHTVDFTVELGLSWIAEDNVQLVHASPLPRGWLYAVTVRGGEDGCTSADGALMAGYYGTFTVP